MLLFTYDVIVKQRKRTVSVSTLAGSAAAPLAPSSTVHDLNNKDEQQQRKAVEHKDSEHNDPSQNGASQQADVADDVSEALEVGDTASLSQAVVHTKVGSHCFTTSSTSSAVLVCMHARCSMQAPMHTQFTHTLLDTVYTLHTTY
jgi:preprotein translocase subunit Sec63